jgi:4-amino-4-deoxy-L-arabinose transferase-like glycosyltransferase
MKFSESIKGKRYIILILFVISVHYLLYPADRYQRFKIENDFLTPFDTMGYLNEALYIKENGGLTNLFIECMTGEYPFASRNPIYLMILSIFAERDISFLIKARIITFITGLLFIISNFLIVNSIFGGAPAVISSFLFLRNHSFFYNSTTVNAEPILMMFCWISFYFIVKGLEDEKNWWKAGIFAGLGYLTKANAIFLVISFIFSGLITIGRRILAKKYFWLFILSFIIVTTPLLIRNTLLFKAPFYSDDTTSLFYEEFKDIFHIKTQMSPPNLKSFIGKHSVNEVFERMVRGIRGEFEVLDYSVRVLVLEEKIPSIKKYSGYFILILCLVGFYAVRNRFLNIFFIISFLIIFLPMAWIYDPIYHPGRYLLLVIPFIFAWASCGLVFLLDQIWEKRQKTA